MPTRAYAAGSAPSPGTSASNAGAKAWPSIAPRNSVGVKTPPTVPEPDRQRRDDEAQQEQREHVPRPPGAVEERGDRLAPVARRSRGSRSVDDAEDEPGRSPSRPAGASAPAEERGARAQREEERGRDHAAQDAERRVEPRSPTGSTARGRARGRRGRGRSSPSVISVAVGRGDRERREGLEREAAEDDLHREEGRPERRVVGARETRPRCRSRRAPAAARGGDTEALAEPRGGGGGDEHDRPLAADGAGRRLGHERGRRAHDRRSAPGRTPLRSTTASRMSQPRAAPAQREPSARTRPATSAAQRGDRDAPERRGERHRPAPCRAPGQTRRGASVAANRRRDRRGRPRSGRPASAAQEHARPPARRAGRAVTAAYRGPPAAGTPRARA